jgi:hypothetical protein
MPPDLQIVWAFDRISGHWDSEIITGGREVKYSVLETRFGFNNLTAAPIPLLSMKPSLSNMGTSPH